MPIVVADRNSLADNEGTRITHLSLHTADPGTTGASEVSGGSYARQPVTWGAAASGTATGGQVTFSVNAGTYPYFGAWSALTGGTFRGGNAVAVSQTLSSAGQILLTVTIPVTAS